MTHLKTTKATTNTATLVSIHGILDAENQEQMEVVKSSDWWRDKVILKTSLSKIGFIREQMGNEIKSFYNKT